MQAPLAGQYPAAFTGGADHPFLCLQRFDFLRNALVLEAVGTHFALDGVILGA